MNSKKNTYKKLFLIFIIIIIITGIIIYINQTTNAKTNTTNNKTKGTTIYNTEEGIVSDKNINEVLFTDISCIIKKEKTQIKYVITNNKDESITLNDYKLIFKNKNDEVIGVVNANLSTELPAKSNINIDNYTTLNLKDAVNLEIELTE